MTDAAFAFLTSSFVTFVSFLLGAIYGWYVTNKSWLMSAHSHNNHRHRGVWYYVAPSKRVPRSTQDIDRINEMNRRYGAAHFKNPHTQDLDDFTGAVDPFGEDKP